MNPNQAEAADAQAVPGTRKPYSAPRLTIHGDVREITRGRPGNAIPDGILGSGGAA